MHVQAIVPASEFVRFKKQMLIFNAIFEKKIDEHVPRFKIAVLETRSEYLAFIFLANKMSFYKKYIYLSEYTLFINV